MPDGSIMPWKVPLKNMAHQKHIISDQAHIFTGDVFAELLETLDNRTIFINPGGSKFVAHTGSIFDAIQHGVQHFRSNT
jgi:hypothetical protein